MTDIEYWSIANSLPKRCAYAGGGDPSVWILDWRSAIPSCPPILAACEWVQGYDPIGMRWVTNTPQTCGSGGGSSSGGTTQYPGGGSSSGGSSSGGGSTTTGSGGGSTTTGGSNPPAGGGGNFTCPTGTVLSGGQCVATNANNLPSINMNYVLIGLAVVGFLMFMRK